MTVLAATDLTVRTTDGVVLLDEVSLSIERGETVLVAGQSGSAKTMLTKAIGGLLASRSNLETSGSVTRPEDVGYLFQNPTTQLVRRTVRHDVAFALENQGVPRAAMERRIEQWADRLDAERFLDRNVDELSRGETAIVALLGSLVTEPDLVVLDEPLAPLDYPNRRLVLDAIETLQGLGSTLLITEHDVRDLLASTDRIVVLDDGRVADRGTPAETIDRLRRIGVNLPFATEVALERGLPTSSVPLTTVPEDNP
ncbi:energy-coupling factor ABC transporter ATP-binding protein [Halanaeroarchaeum sulfurireducens]|uniref:Cobalt transport ATP-binding protein n=1 Tax=Halanaeroarchaeum sulfurireducens TaxID=1604004 RepID=A0A0F7P6M9_9EURY|nr:energy-coupling factor ABC transporter ATP-binding protein [Halanaeroarchaeum sulfurireducens]AKH96821.1 cobalt transport ATP-binding protein [Halanaeroarchaeum sulfurireducens]ALG81223.1 cobalt transport ATP-binding protein [Halanaeroarchaeum sulfurireducens]